MLVLAGLGIIVIGFALRLNPLAVVVAAALVTGLAAGLPPLAVVASLGKAFAASRYVSLVWLVVPVIGLLERYGLQERAKAMIAGVGAATPGRLLGIYFVFRQATAAAGLVALAGQAQTVRPLVAPMAEAAAGRAREGQARPPLAPQARARLRAMAAATDNIAVFFAEDIFVAVASILLIKGFLAANGIAVTPFGLSLWAIPTAVAALVVHGARLWRLDRRLAR